MVEKLKIAVIQTEIFWENKALNIEQYTNIIAQITGPVDIIVLPETFTTGFSMKAEIAESSNETVSWMIEMATSKQAAIAGSFFVQEGEKCYNRLYFVEPSGKTTYYNKRHLFGLTKENEIFSPGNEQVIVEYLGWKISLLVCYDLRFPVWIRRSLANDYDLILVVANWPERRSFAWSQLLIARAIENQSFVVGANRIGKDGCQVLHSGDSAIIDPMGQYIGEAGSFSKRVLLGELEFSKLNALRKSLPFFKDGDNFSF